MKLTLSNPITIALAALALFAGFYAAYLFATPSTVHAGAGELPGVVATTSVSVIGTTPSLAFATSTCGARVITTTASPIMITFSDVQGSQPSGNFGTLQPASTTVVYSNASFGCGAYRIYSFSSGNVFLMESR